jgi:hypothetical protein
MNKPSPKINFEHLSQQKPTSTKKTKKGKKKKQEKEEQSTRDIRFNRRTVANFLTVFFYLLFFSMFVVLLVFNSRLGEIHKVATTQAIDTEKISAAVQQQNDQMDTIKYEGKTFLKILFSYRPEEQGKKDREKQLQSYLGKNLSTSNLLLQSNNEERSVNEVEFIQAERLKRQTYRFFYNVTYTEKNEKTKLGIKLVISYEGEKFQLINVPAVTVFQENNNDSTATYKPEDYYTKGEEVSEENTRKINDFLQNFMDMYLTNDERLPLVSAVQGLGSGKLSGFTIDNLVQTANDTYAIQGTYTFSVQEDSQITSFYDCQLKMNKDSYFVESFN